MLIKSNHVLAAFPAPFYSAPALTEKAGEEVHVNQRMKDGSGIIVLSLSHMINDWYMNVLQVLIPFFAIAGIRTGRSAFLVTAFTVSSSLLQPFFGYLVDRSGRRWMPYAGTLWMAGLLGVVGLEHSYPLMFVTVLLSGLGTAAFHPQASAMVASLGGERRAFSQAFFIAFGNVGWALTPLLVVPLIQRFGLSSTPAIVIPGIVSAGLLWLVGRNVTFVSRPRDAGSGGFFPEGSAPELVRIVTVVAARSLVYFSLIAFLPLYLAEKGIPVVSSSRLLFLMLFSGALGGLAGGFISDRWNRKGVISISLILSTVLFLLFLCLHGVVSIVFLCLAGAALLSSFSVTVVLAHNVLRKGAATASGIILGLGTGIGGLGVGLLGQVVEHFGASGVIHCLVMLPLLAGLFALTLKEHNR